MGKFYWSFFKSSSLIFLVFQKFYKDLVLSNLRRRRQNFEKKCYIGPKGVFGNFFDVVQLKKDLVKTDQGGPLVNDAT